MFVALLCLLLHLLRQDVRPCGGKMVKALMKELGQNDKKVDRSLPKKLKVCCAIFCLDFVTFVPYACAF